MIETTVGLGAAAGIHVATWGAYKDAPFEGFRPVSYLRSVVLAIVAAVALLAWPAVRNTSNVLVVIGVVYATERLATEWWKAIVRVEDQSVYSIPMRLGFHGRPVDNPLVRYGAGILVILAIAATMAAAATIQYLLPNVPDWLTVATVGATGGWATAIGGAWKDAPIEGFSPWKFLRSPVVAMFWAIPLSLMTTDWVLLSVSAGGMAVASIETYKTFLTGGRPPGKFATRPIRHNPNRMRPAFAAIHVSLWALLAVTQLLAHDGPRLNGGHLSLGTIVDQVPSIVLRMPTVAAAMFAVLIILAAGARPVANGRTI